MNSTEYPNVLKTSRDKELLLEAHSRGITQQEARRIVYTYLDEDELPELDFTATTMRGLAQSVRGRIRLPITPTLGITLHEVAHIIQRHDKGHSIDGVMPHGQEFVTILDNLVFSEHMWEKEPYTETDLSN